MTVARLRHGEAPFFNMAREAAQDSRLSWEATGVHTFLLSKPTDWKINVRALANERPKSGRKDRMQRILGELRKFGYLTVEQERQADGTFDWIATVWPLPQASPQVAPCPGEPDMGEPDTANPPLHRTDRTENRETEKPPLPPRSAGGSARDSLSEEHRAMVDRIFEAWRATDPDRHKHRGKPTTQDQRKIMARLRDGMSEADIILAVTAWPFDDWDERKRADRHTINVLLMNEAKAIEWAELGRQHEADTRRRLDRDKPVDWEFYARQAERLRLEQSAGQGDLDSAPDREDSESDTVGTLLAAAFGGIE